MSGFHRASWCSRGKNIRSPSAASRDYIHHRFRLCCDSFLTWIFLCSFPHHFKTIGGTEMADVKQIQQMIPLITCEISLGQYVCELVLGVPVLRRFPLLRGRGAGIPGIGILIHSWYCGIGTSSGDSNYSKSRYAETSTWRAHGTDDINASTVIKHCDERSSVGTRGSCENNGTVGVDTAPRGHESESQSRTSTTNDSTHRVWNFLWFKCLRVVFLVSMYLIWILESRLIRSNNQSRATLWVLETCLIVWLLPLMIILITASLSSNTYNKASW